MGDLFQGNCWSINPSSLATDIAEWLVQQGMSFREAHEVSGRAVAMCEQRSIDLQDLSGEDLASLSPVLTVEMIQGLSVESALDARSGVGGTAPSAVAAQHEALRAQMKVLRSALAS